VCGRVGDGLGDADTGGQYQDGANQGERIRQTPNTVV